MKWTSTLELVKKLGSYKEQDHIADGLAVLAEYGLIVAVRPRPMKVRMSLHLIGGSTIMTMMTNRKFMR
jgi:hypothetical protein